MLGKLLAPVYFDFSSVPILVAIILLTPLITYACTYGASMARLQSNASIKKPPLVPYWIPLIGNSLELGKSMEAFLTKYLKRFGASTPFEICTNMRMCCVAGSENIAQMFKLDHDLSVKPRTLLLLGKVFGVPKQDIKKIERDTTGILRLPHPDSPEIEPDQFRWEYISYKTQRAHLEGPALDGLARRFLENLEKGFAECEIGPEWIEIPDLCNFLQRELSKASIQALCGPYILTLNPTFIQDFWSSDKNISALMKGIPRWVSPKPYRMRDKIVDEIMHWIEHGIANIDWNDPEHTDVEYEEYFGARMMRAIQQDIHKYPTSHRGNAAQQLGFIWAATANTVRANFWIVYELFSSSSLLADTRQVIQTLVPSSPQLKLEDVEKLTHHPLLQSIYAEVLRIYVSSMPMRSPIDHDLQIGRWVFKKGSLLLASSWHEHRALESWNVGRQGERPLDEFWAERFITYPSDPFSGPLKPSRRAMQGPVAHEVATKSNLASFTTENLEGSWFPYSGGSHICPGRFLAKQEILSAMALIVTTFDMEVIDIKRAEPDLSFLGFGSLPPKGKVPVKIRRRV